MKHAVAFLIYVGIGCAYQSTYDDVSISHVVSADTPISTFGHIFAWPFVIVYHSITWVLLGIAALVVVAAVGCVVLWAVDKWQVQQRRKRFAARRAAH